MTRPTLRRLLVLAPALAALAWLLLRGASDSAPQAGTGTTEVAAPTANAAPVQQVAAPADVGSAPTPPPVATAAHVPAGSDLAALVERAREGEAEAACRVALLAAGCMTADLPADIESMLVRQAAAQDDPAQQAMVNMLASDAERREGRNARCAEIRRLDPPEAAASLETAARAGHGRAQVLFALFRSDSGQLARLPLRYQLGASGIQHSRMSLVSAHYTAFARQYLQQGVQARDPLALEGLLMLHAPDELGGGPALRLREPDLQRFALLGRVLQELRPDLPEEGPFQTLLRASLDSLDADQRAALERAVDAETRRWRAGSAPRWPDPGAPDPAPEALCTR